MTLDEIEAMTEAEYDAMPHTKRVEAMEIVLESLCADGLAYKGADGRYRIREDVKTTCDGDIMTATKSAVN